MYPNVFLLVISAKFKKCKDREPDPDGPGKPDSELSSEHLHEEALGIDSLRSVDVILGCIRAILKPPCHLSAPNVEAQCDEESRGEGHADSDHVDDKWCNVIMSSNLHMKMLEITSIKALKKLLSLFL